MTRVDDKARPAIHEAWLTVNEAWPAAGDKACPAVDKASHSVDKTWSVMTTRLGPLPTRLIALSTQLRRPFMRLGRLSAVDKAQLIVHQARAISLPHRS